MIRVFLCAGLLAAAACAQSSDANPRFEATDVRVSAHNDTDFLRFMRGPAVHDGRYTIRTASMAELVSTAYGVGGDKVFGGPTWLEWDRFDVVGKIPAHSAPEDQKKMLQALLADRFGLVAHADVRPMPAYLLSASAHPKLKEADTGPAAGKGCRGKPRPQNIAPGTIVPNEVTCSNLSMAEFAEQLQQMAGGYLQQPVMDRTELKGSYDFDLKWTSRGALAAAGAEGISIYDAVEKQLGLKLELQKAPQPVVVVDRVNELPTENAPDIDKTLPGVAPPTEFEVAEVKPTPADYMGQNFQIQKSGQINLQGVTLKLVIQQAWQVFSDDMLVGAPKWLDSTRFDIVAKAPKAALVDGGGNGPPIDIDAIFAMLKNLLAERFKMQTHWEERPINAFSLMAGKPRMKPADPNGRITCQEGPAAGQADTRDKNPILGRLINCHNMTMDRFSSMLMSLAPGYIHAPVQNATGLDGAFDFSLSFSTAGQLRGNEGDGGRGATGGPNAAASDPNGALSLPDAVVKQLGLKLEQTRRPVKVLVIDHIEEKPIEN